MTQLRRAELGDAPALSALKQAAFYETFVQGFGIAYTPADIADFFAVHYSIEAVARELADPSIATWVVDTGDTLVGYAKIAPCKLPHPEATPAQGELCQLYVLNSAQSQGWGGRLMRAALDHLAIHFPGPVWLGVWSGNAKAQAFYKRLGFKQVGEYRFIVGETQDHEYIFRRD